MGDEPGRDVYVHPQVISYPSASRRRQHDSEWVNNALTSTYNAFFRASWTSVQEGSPRYHTKIGIFITPTANAIQRPDRRYDWHCWGASIIRLLYSGYSLLIYDCDSDSELSFH